MSEFTYQEKPTHSRLETYEWDNTWWEKTAENDKRRVLYIGDSISCGTRRFCNQNANGEILFDGFGTSKAIDNPYFKESLLLFVKQQSHREAILFNNGLHGFHLSGEEYGRYYEDFVDFLKSNFPRTPIILVLTTDVKERSETTEKVLERNKKAMEIAANKGCEVADLFAVSREIESYHTDPFHFEDKGYSILADALIEKVKEVLKK
ncbi:MAG: SGNH/GDSL hydrolase family protein [Clostridia bacterium]|nr:SGNH/GDSL hydrolase family protein [Clostridia bacterium]MEE1185034.1 SGNH/GDSL hydrolase family protein [Acutalibacteraceae bacterium]